jgi:hypothetical protein
MVDFIPLLWLFVAGVVIGGVLMKCYLKWADAHG